jgi:hypothetical protein
MVQLRGLGGGFATASPTDGAVSAVSEPFKLFALGIPALPELAIAIPHGFAALDAALAPHLTGRSMPNFVGEHEDDVSGHDQETLERLRTIKWIRDPHRVIRSKRPCSAPSPVSERSAFWFDQLVDERAGQPSGIALVVPAADRVEQQIDVDAADGPGGVGGLLGRSA